MSGKHWKAFTNLQSCFTDSSLIHLILLIKLIQYKVGKTRMLLIVEVWWLFPWLLLFPMVVSRAEQELLKNPVLSAFVKMSGYCGVFCCGRITTISCTNSKCLTFNRATNVSPELSGGMTLWHCICVQKGSLFHQEDHPISRIFYSRDNQFSIKHIVASDAKYLSRLVNLIWLQDEGGSRQFR